MIGPAFEAVVSAYHSTEIQLNAAQERWREASRRCDDLDNPGGFPPSSVDIALADQQMQRADDALKQAAARHRDALRAAVDFLETLPL